MIEVRNLWKDKQEEVIGGNVVHDEAGTLYCYDLTQAVPVRRKMSFMGHEKNRGTLKYRCPARHEGIPCPMTRSATVIAATARPCG